MKRLFLLAIVVLTMVACNKNEDISEATSAAQKVYDEYADSQDLTVALTGNYLKAGNAYNAVMLQAMTDEAWQRLLARYGKDSFAEGRLSSLEITDLNSDIPVETIEEVLALLVDSLLSASGAEQTTLTMSKTYTDGKLLNEYLTMDDNVDTEELENLVHNELSHPEVGYVTYIESDEQTVWLFFYDSEASYQAIMNHIL